MAFVRDKQTGAVINTDDSYYRSILALRDSQKQAQMLCGELDSLKSEMATMRDLLKQVMDGKKNV